MDFNIFQDLIGPNILLSLISVFEKTLANIVHVGAT